VHSLPTWILSNSHPFLTYRLVLKLGVCLSPHAFPSYLTICLLGEVDEKQRLVQYRPHHSKEALVPSQLVQHLGQWMRVSRWTRLSKASHPEASWRSGAGQWMVSSMSTAMLMRWWAPTLGDAVVSWTQAHSLSGGTPILERAPV
jgi:hypothetical protein